MRRALVALLALLGAMSGSAQAAEVSTKASTLYVTAGAGEANDLRVEYDTARSGWVVTDIVPLVAGSGCSVDGSAVFCPGNAGSRSVSIELGDGNDGLALGGRPGTAYVSDGDGNDDVVVEADADGTLITAGAGADTYTSLNGRTSVDYLSKRPGVKITPDGVADDGSPGEGDNIVGNFSRFTGTNNSDEIHADEDGTDIGGNGGGDLLVGGPGDDLFWAFEGPNGSVQAGAGDDAISGDYWGDDGTISGGSGDDSLLLNIPAPGYVFSEGIDVTLDGVANDGPSGGRRNVMPDLEFVNIQIGRLTGSDNGEELRATWVDGRGGNDTLWAGTMIGGSGRDRFRWTGGNSSKGAIHAQDGEVDTIDCDGRPPVFEVDVFDVVGCPPPPPPPAAPGPAFGTIAAKPATTRADRHGTFVLRIHCAGNSAAPCTGLASLRPRNGIRTTYAKASFRGIKPGTSKRVRFKLAARYRRSLARGRSIAGRLMVDTTASGTTSVQRNDSAGLVRIKPARQA